MNLCIHCNKFNVKGKGNCCKRCGGVIAAKRAQEKRANMGEPVIEVKPCFYEWQQKINWWAMIHESTKKMARATRKKKKQASK